MAQTDFCNLNDGFFKTQKVHSSDQPVEIKKILETFRICKSRYLSNKQRNSLNGEAA